MVAISLSEKFVGTPYASAHLYGSWWFCSLWVVLSVTSILYILKTKIASKNILLLHLSFVVILVGALLTHLYSFRGVVHLRVGETTQTYLEEGDEGMKLEPLPFSIKLENFYRIPWTTWRDMKQIYGRKHIKQAELEPFRLQYISGVIKMLEGIEISYTEEGDENEQ